MQKHYKYLIKALAIACIAIVATTSCQRISNIELSNSASQVVIEGVFTDQPFNDTVKLSRSGSFYNPGNYPVINNATVIINDDAGNTDTLQFVGDGKYVPTTLTGVPGRTYHLKVLADGKQYDASSTMPAPVAIDSVYSQPNGSGLDTNYRIRCFFKDPEGLGNYYRLQLYVNSQLYDSIGNLTTAQDKFVDGTEMNVRLRGKNAYYGDTVTVFLMAIDEITYKFFSVARSNAGSGNPVSTAVPQNPPSNVTGGALGYFSACALRSKTVVAHQ